jgi:hypothetical protein
MHHDSPWPRRGPRALAPFCGATVLALAAGVSLGGCAHAQALPMGSFASTGGLLGAWETTATSCHSGVTTSPLGANTVVWFAHGRYSAFELSTGAISGRTSAAPYL